MAYKYIVGTRKSRLAQEDLPNKYELFHKTISTTVNANASEQSTRPSLPGSPQIFIVPTLSLVFDDISSANTLVGNASNVEDWNTFFDLPTYGNPYIEVVINGNEVRLTGGSNVIIKESLFEYYQNLVSCSDTGTVIELSAYSFYGIESITSVSFSNVLTLGDSVFEYCNTLSSISLPNATNIGGFAIGDCTSLVSISLESANTFGFKVFNGCSSLESVNLPLIISITSDIFFECPNLSSLNLVSAISISNSVFENLEFLETVYCPNLETIGDEAFRNCNALTSVVFGEVTSVGDRSFYDCDSLTSVNLPKAVSIGLETFSYCPLLSTVSIPNATDIGNNNFEECTSLISIDASSCTSLGSTVDDDGVFSSISGNTITLTIPSALMTCNLGNPDGDIQYLQANNTVTIITT